MILKCDLDRVFETSQRFSFSTRLLRKKSEGSYIYIKKNTPSMNREHGYQLPPIYHQLLLPEQFPRTKTSRDQVF